MSIIHGYITVREDEALLKAIAAETAIADDEVTESFLNEMSTDYPHYKGKRTTVVENPDEQDKIE